MALAFLNRCGFRATSSGTGSFVVASALTGMQTPAQCAGPAVIDEATYRYFAQSDDLTQWEYGFGVYDVGTTTITRATVYDNSSGGTTALSFSAAPRVYMGGPLAQDMSAWQPLQTATASSVASIQFDLPTDYSLFRLSFYGVNGDEGTTLFFAFSTDGGSTWIYDDSGFAAYRVFKAEAFTGGSETPSGFDDSLGLINSLAGDSGGMSGSCTIYAGAASQYAHVKTEAAAANASEGALVRGFSAPTVTGRMNAIMLLPYGNGDAPPTSGSLITAGYFVLEGLR